jgi:hypothetical protein
VGCGSADGAGVTGLAQPRGDAGPVERVRAPREDEATLAVARTPLSISRTCHHLLHHRHRPVVVKRDVIARRQPLVIVVKRDVGDALSGGRRRDGCASIGSRPPPRELLVTFVSMTHCLS